MGIAPRHAKHHRYAATADDGSLLRRWYADESRDVNAIPNALWQSMTREQRALMRFPVIP
jgi:hypothetical protein